MVTSVPGLPRFERCNILYPIRLSLLSLLLIVVLAGFLCKSTGYLNNCHNCLSSLSNYETSSFMCLLKWHGPELFVNSSCPWNGMVCKTENLEQYSGIKVMNCGLIVYKQEIHAVHDYIVFITYTKSLHLMSVTAVLFRHVHCNTWRWHSQTMFTSISWSFHWRSQQ